MRRAAARREATLDNSLDNVANAAMRATLTFALADDERDFRIAMQGSDAVQPEVPK